MQFKINTDQLLTQIVICEIYDLIGSINIPKFLESIEMFREQRKTDELNLEQAESEVEQKIMRDWAINIYRECKYKVKDLIADDQVKFDSSYKEVRNNQLNRLRILLKYLFETDNTFVNERVLAALDRVFDQDIL